MAKEEVSKPPKGSKGQASDDDEPYELPKLAFTDEEGDQLRSLCKLSDSAIKDIEKFLFVDFALRSRLPQRSPARKEKDELEALVRSIGDTLGRLEHLDPFMAYRLDLSAHHGQERAIKELTRILAGVKRKGFLPKRQEGNPATTLTWIVLPVARILRRHGLTVKSYSNDFRTVLEVCLSSIGYDDVSIEALVRRDSRWVKRCELDDEAGDEAEDEAGDDTDDEIGIEADEEHD
jgi:hypothetical protein